MTRFTATAEDLRYDFLLVSQLEYLLENGGPRTDAKLHEFIRLYLGFDVPQHAHCPNHVAPFSFIADQFFDRVESCLGFANRSGGKTQEVAILNACDMIFKAGVEICSAGAVNSQAKRGWDYLCGMIMGCSDYFELIYGSPPMIKKDTLYLPNGSNAQIVTASFAGLNSPHPNRTRIDEVELIHFDLITESMCLVGDTLIPTNRGVLPIREVRAQDLVWGWSLQKGSLCHSVVTWAGQTGVRDTLKLEFSNGQSLFCTPNHPILCEDGTYQPADRLVPGRRVVGASLHQVREAVSRRVPEKDGFLRGVLEGSEAHEPREAPLLRLRQGSARLVQVWKEAFASLSTLLAEVRGQATDNLLGLRQASTGPWYRALSEMLGAPLGYSWAASGFPETTRGQYAKEATESRGAMDGRAATRPRSPLQAIGTAWALGARLRSDRRAGSDRGARQLLARQAEGPSEGQAKTDSVGSGRLCGDRSTLRPSPSLVELLRISPGPRAAVYDLTVPATQSFLANGVIVHNSMTQSSRGIKAQDTYTSTRKVSAGTMQKLIDEAPEKGIAIKAWCIFEVLERCTRKCKADPVHGDCPIFSRKMADGTERTLCGGEAHDVPGGYYGIPDFIKKARNMDADTFDAQWLCRRPNTGQLVYGQQFRDDDRLIVRSKVEQEEILERFRESAKQRAPWNRIYGQDFGSHWATAGWIQDPVNERLYKYWEYYYEPPGDRSVAAHCDYIKDNDPLGFDLHDHTGFADPAGRQVITDMEDHGIFFLPANNQRYSGINFMKALMEKRLSDDLPAVRFFGSCVRTIKEMGELYIHKANRDGTFNRDKIVDRDDHCVDSDRYALFSFHTLGTQQYSMRRLRGV